MSRLIFAFIVLIHGLIHLLGFVKEYKLAPVKQVAGIVLPGGMAKVIGLLWLVACLLFAFSAVAFVIKKDWWWIIGITGVVLSQVLIIMYWHDARFGTIVNVIVLAGCILSYGSWNFQRIWKKDLDSILLERVANQHYTSPEKITGLPLVVQKWLGHSNIAGDRDIQNVYMKQEGVMLSKPEGKWMPFKAEEYFAVGKPGFIWIADVKAASLVRMAGRDLYENGKGHMLIRLYSLIPVVDSKGEKIDQGSMLRYLGEIIWFPVAALSPYIHWEPVDSTQARATMTYGGISATGVFRFNTEGEVVSFESMRYFDRRDGATLEHWFISAGGYKEFGGMRVPSEATVTWKMKDGDFTWLKLKVTAVKYSH
ncbi:MAG: hypothetical protein GYA43_13110 [Bacteroidales bacterium]|nr:hypothetical protein [Bacteroidales bacterium]